MKILHTADWHLGKRLEGRSRLPEQMAVLDEICGIAETHKVDVVLIAGDLYDHFNPATEAIDLFYRTLKRLSRGGCCAVVAIAGNHDSPEMIEVPHPLAKECGIVMVGFPNSLVKPFETTEGVEVTKSTSGFIELALPDVEFPLRLVLTPYANEVRLKKSLSEDKEADLRKLLEEHWQRLATTYCDQKGVNILMAHLFFSDNKAKQKELLELEGEGERSILVGGASSIFTENIPSEIQYTALGHLHRYQNLAKKDQSPIIYSSSPLCYSFAEANQEKYVCVLNAKPNAKIEVEKIGLKEGKRLLRKTFLTEEEACEWLEQNQNTWVEISLHTDTFLDGQIRKKLHSLHEGIVNLIPILNEKELGDAEYDLQQLDMTQDIESLFAAYFYQKNQLPISDELKEIFREIL